MTRFGFLLVLWSIAVCVLTGSGCCSWSVPSANGRWSALSDAQAQAEGGTPCASAGQSRHRADLASIRLATTHTDLNLKDTRPSTPVAQCRGGVAIYCGIAQQVEQRSLKPRVSGSTPDSTSTQSSDWGNGAERFRRGTNCSSDRAAGARPAQQTSNVRLQTITQPPPQTQWSSFRSPLLPDHGGVEEVGARVALRRVHTGRVSALLRAGTDISRWWRRRTPGRQRPLQASRAATRVSEGEETVSRTGVRYPDAPRSEVQGVNAS
jgi:hypothetical protein